MFYCQKNGKQKQGESYTSKYQKHAACSYTYKLVYTDDKFRPLLSHTYAKMLLKALLIVSSKKVFTVMVR